MTFPLLSSAPAKDAQIDIRMYDGPVETLTDFVNAVWSTQFPDAFTCPQWDNDYFSWRQFGQDRHVRIAAFMDDRLVGYVFGEGLPFLWRGEPVNGMFSTTLAVDPALKGTGVAKRLSARLRDVIREQNLAFMYGFAVPGRASLGPKFWVRQHGGVRNPGIRPFVRPIDAQTLARNAGTAGERITARFAKLAHLDAPRRARQSVRGFEARDLESCLTLLRAAEEPADLRFDWTPELLNHALDFNDTPHTLVAEDGAKVTGFATWHRTWFRGRGRFATGIVDHCVGPDSATRRALLDGVMAQMAEQGIALATCPSSASTPIADLLRAGFVPLPQRYDLILLFNDEAYQPSDIRELRVHLG